MIKLIALAGVLLVIGEATTVTWAMFGPSPYVSKLMGLFVNMDAMVGGQFEKGLTTLKAKSET